MLRLTLMLSAAIYAGLVIYGDPSRSDGLVTTPDVARAATPTAPALASARSGDAMLTTANGQVLEIAAFINPVRLVPNDLTRVASVTTVSPIEEQIIASASVADPALPIVRVTGNRVNVRSGPSTNNTVVGSLSRGQEAELVASLGNGWAQIRGVATGVEGYMADRFLEQVN